MSSIKIQQKVFSLGNKSGKNLDKKDKVVLVVNGNVTTIEVQNVFKGKPDVGKDYIKGYSLLSTFEQTENNILKFRDLEIALYNATTSEPIKILERSNPAFQLGDKIFTDEEVNSFIELIKTGIPQEPEVINEEIQVGDLPTAVSTEQFNQLAEIGYSPVEVEGNNSSLFFSNEKEPKLIKIVEGKIIPLELFTTEFPNKVQFLDNEAKFELELEKEEPVVAE